MSKRILPDRPLTRSERTARWRASRPGYLKQWKLAHPEKVAVYNETVKLKRRELGRTKYVYRWVREDGSTAYVGRGTMQRVTAHRTVSPWWEEGMILHIKRARNEWHAMQLEGVWGEAYHPSHNIEGFRDLPHWQERVR